MSEMAEIQGRLEKLLEGVVPPEAVPQGRGLAPGSSRESGPDPTGDSEAQRAVAGVRLRPRGSESLVGGGGEETAGDQGQDDSRDADQGHGHPQADQVPRGGPSLHLEQSPFSESHDGHEGSEASGQAPQAEGRGIEASGLEGRVDDKPEGVPEDAGVERRKTDQKRSNGNGRGIVADGISRAQIALAIQSNRGDYSAAARALGVGLPSLRQRIKNDPQLRAAFLFRDGVEGQPSALEVAVRRDLPMPVQDNVLADIISAQDREILRNGLQNSGIRPSTIDKLRSFDGFAENSGKFLAGSLDLTHRMMIFQVVALFELAEQIKSKYLENDTLSHGVRIEWQKAYNEIAELISKAYDRTLTGTQVMVNIMRNQKDDKGEGKKRKPAFKIKMAEPVKDAAKN